MTKGMQRIHSAVRNFACRFLAVGLTALGSVRRARKRALGGNLVTAIYFHHPNKRLFLRCIQWLAKNGYQFISADELVSILHEGKPAPKGAVWLSFDDGCRELLIDVLPAVRERKIPVTLFIPSGIVEGDGYLPWLQATRNGKRHSLTVAELQAVAESSEVTIGSHTVSHADMPLCAEETLANEVGRSKRSLESWTGSPVACFSYPYGHFSGRERQHLIRHGYKLAATTENAFVTPRTDLYLVPRFAVANDISFPEAVCNMVGVWRPVVETLQKALRKVRGPQP